MPKKISPRLTLLCLGLSLFLSLAAGCKNAPEPKQTAAPTPSKTAAASTPAPAATAAPGSVATGETAPGPISLTDKVPVSVNDLPEVVAKVNGQPIRKRELLQGAQVVQMRLAQVGRPMAPSAAFYRQVLNELIAITLLQQDARSQGVVASDQEVQSQIDARKGAFANEDAYHKALKESGVTEDILRQQARDQISVSKYVNNKLVHGINVTDQATREFYDKNKEKIRTPERLHVRHILIGVAANATPADKQKARAKAEDLLKQIQNGADFAKLAQENSDDTGSKVHGGDLGWIVPGQTVPAFDKAAMALKPNQVSPVVESPFGFHIIQLLERQPAGAVPYEQAKERIARMLKEQQAQQQVEARVRELRAKGKVEVYI
jgi:peptidyl-prolyl cis-trans isomerase C